MGRACLMKCRASVTMYYDSVINDLSKKAAPFRGGLFRLRPKAGTSGFATGMF